MSDIENGTKVIIHTATGEALGRRAVSGIVDGADFPVVWVTTEEEWAEAEANGGRAEALPWPAEDVEPAEDANAVAFRVVNEATAER